MPSKKAKRKQSSYQEKQPEAKYQYYPPVTDNQALDKSTLRFFPLKSLIVSNF